MAVYQSRKSIEDFKSNLANGGVRPTMFEVQIAFPDVVSEVEPALTSLSSQQSTLMRS